ncbi:MAG: hypothetical protein IPL31_11825 [Saprospiraceae bacterium]|nr:hypothetical protein [Saprospiraceae bacterium]
MSINGDKLIFATTSTGVLSKKPSCSINAIDLETGKLVHEDSYKVNGEIENFLSCDGVELFQTDKEINIYDLSKGVHGFSNPITVRKNSPSERLLMTVHGDLVYFFSTKDNQLYSIDLIKNTMKPVLSGALPFGKKEENVSNIEMRGDNIYLQSDQNMYLISPNGKMLYHTFYNPIEGAALYAFNASKMAMSMAGEIVSNELNKGMEKRLNKQRAKFISEGKSIDDVQKRAEYASTWKTSGQATSEKYEETNLYKAIAERKSLINGGSNSAVLHGRIKRMAQMLVSLAVNICPKSSLFLILMGLFWHKSIWILGRPKSFIPWEEVKMALFHHLILMRSVDNFTW